VSNILDLERCYEFKFFRCGLKRESPQRAMVTDRDGNMFVKHEGKRCIVDQTEGIAFVGPVEILHSGRDKE